MTSSHLDTHPRQWCARLADPLDKRSAPRLVLLFLGAILARGRRTVTSGIRAAGLSDPFRPCYATVAAAGKKADDIAARLALDDTPTPRYGPHVQGAGVHHNPTPGPAGSAAMVGEILTTVAERFSLETAFRDCKEIVGAGQQQVRFVWASVGAFHICLWTFTMTEVWAWIAKPQHERRVPVGPSAEDTAWAAYELNKDCRDYDVVTTAEDRHFDRLAEEASAMDRAESGIRGS